MAVHTRMSYKVKVRCMTLPEMVWEFCDTYSLLDIYSFFCSRDLLTSRKDRKRGATAVVKSRIMRQGQLRQVQRL